MFLFYVDESGNRNPRTESIRADGTKLELDWIYVLSAACIFEKRWHGFNKTLDRYKAKLISKIWRNKKVKLELADCEIKSTRLRVSKTRATHPFLQHLADTDVTSLADIYYRQLEYHNMYVFAVIIDKRYLREYMTANKLHRKSWELFCELVERFMRTMHPRHQAVMIADGVSKEVNRSLAMKHAYLQDQGTSSGLWLTKICEMPLFVRSELSNGVQPHQRNSLVCLQKLLNAYDFL